MKKEREIVAAFLLSQMPEERIAELETLASLDYPIPDRKSLQEQLEKRMPGKGENGGCDDAANGEASWRMQRIMHMFSPTDFGLDTPQGALEKYFHRLSRIQMAYRPNPFADWGSDADLPPEPRGHEPFVPEFGSDACGEAAQEQWNEYLQDPLTRLLGPSHAHYQYLKRKEDYCRRSSQNPRYTGDCGESGNLAWARCFMRSGPSSRCRAAGELARNTCLLVRGGIDVPGADGPWIELPPDIFWPGGVRYFR